MLYHLYNLFEYLNFHYLYQKFLIFRLFLNCSIQFKQSTLNFNRWFYIHPFPCSQLKFIEFEVEKCFENIIRLSYNFYSINKYFRWMYYCLKYFLIQIIEKSNSSFHFISNKNWHWFLKYLLIFQAQSSWKHKSDSIAIQLPLNSYFVKCYTKYCNFLN